MICQEEKMRALKNSYFVTPNLIRGLVTTDFIRTCPDENQDAESSGLCLASHQHDILCNYRLSQYSQDELKNKGWVFTPSPV